MAATAIAAMAMTMVITIATRVRGDNHIENKE